MMPQEDYRGTVSDTLLEKHEDHPLFATLTGRDTTYGWTENGPDLTKMRANPAGRTWHF